MKIIKYAKKKNGMYQVFLESGNNIEIHEELILKYELLLKKDLSLESINEILNLNNKYICYDVAIKYISNKLRTKKEIKEYLLKKEYDEKTVDEVILKLSCNNYIDDYSYAKFYVNDRILLSTDGPLKIKSKLFELGVCEDAILSALDLFTSDIQLDKISKLTSKMMKSNRNKSSYILKNKIITNLCTLGYDRSIVVDYVSSQSVDESDVVKKEYDKIYKKLSKKYSGSELEYKVKQKMYSLGFKNYNIE